MHVLLIDEAFASGLAKDGMHYLWVEVDNDGFVERELGFDEHGRIVHRYPGIGPFGEYGLFDMNKFDVSPVRGGDIEPDEFQRAWDKPSSV